MKVNSAEPVNDYRVDYDYVLIDEESPIPITAASVERTRPQPCTGTGLFAAVRRSYISVPQRFCDCTTMVFLTNLIWIFVVFSDHGSVFPTRELSLLLLLFCSVMICSLVVSWFVRDEPTPIDDQVHMILPLQTHAIGNEIDSGTSATMDARADLPSTYDIMQRMAPQAGGCPSVDYDLVALARIGRLMSELGSRLGELANELKSPQDHDTAQMTELTFQLMNYLSTFRPGAAAYNLTFGARPQANNKDVCSHCLPSLQTATHPVSPILLHNSNLPEAAAASSPVSTAPYDANMDGFDNGIMEEFANTFCGQGIDDTEPNLFDQGSSLDQALGEALYNEFTSNGSLNDTMPPSTTIKGKKRRKSRVLVANVSIKTDNDVLFGKGGMIINHPGNKAFRQRAHELWPYYQDSSKAVKQEIAHTLANEVKKNGHKFLEKGQDGEWHEVIYGYHTKASQTFRDLHKRSTK